MIIVIGATGYIGRYFCCEMNNRGINVLALGRSKQVLDFFQAKGIASQYFDLNQKDSFSKLPNTNVEAIIDLSAKLAELETPIEDFFNINTMGVYKTLDFAYKNNIKKVIFTSTHKVYNNVNKNVISEADMINFHGNHTPYIISKVAAEHFAKYYNDDYGMNAITLRLTGVHGYGEILGHLNADGSYTKSAFEVFFEKALKADPIYVWGNQAIKRDHIYIKDVVNALYSAVKAKEAKGIYNIASGVGYSQYEEALALSEVFAPKGKKSEVFLDESKPGLTHGYVYSIEKAQKELNWKPAFTNMIEMYQDYKREWESKVYHNYHKFALGQAPATL